jgi:endonuclease/exonuclease/phosphatase family metal-dependent hydrolase
MFNPAFLFGRGSKLLPALLIPCLFFGSDAALGASDQPASEPLSVMTFNLRFASPRPPNSWPERRPVMKALLEETKPDIIGTQEGLYAQLKDIANDLPEYAWIGLGRDGGSRGEFMAVYYRTERFEPLAYDHFWLSDTPEVMASTTWGNSNRRMVTWVRFLDKKNQREFYFWNTHLDHQIQEAREKSALLIRDRINALNTTLPVILLGDFNAAAGANRTFDILVGEGGFTDTWDTAKERRGEVVGTFHGYRPAIPNGLRIDWILTRGPLVADATEIPTFSQNGQFPSDHFPVMAWLRFGGNKAASGSTEP